MGVAIALVGVLCGASVPLLLSKSTRWYTFAGNAMAVVGAGCNVAAAAFAPQSEIQPLAGLMVPATVALDALVRRRRPPATFKFWSCVALVVLGDASIVAWSPPMRSRAGESTDSVALWVVIAGCALACVMVLRDLEPSEFRHHGSSGGNTRAWVAHGMRPGLVSGFAITSTNAFFAGATAVPQHPHTVVFGLFALGLAGSQIVLLNQAARAASPVHVQSVYVSCVIASGTLTGLATVAQTAAFTPLRIVWLGASLVAVVAGAYGVAIEHHGTSSASI